MTTRKAKTIKPPEGVRITVGGTDYDLFPDELTGEDAAAFRRATGFRLVEMFGGFSHDLDTLAGLVWLVRRKDEPGLTYLEVARSLTLGNYPDTERIAGDAAGEAPAAS